LSLSRCRESQRKFLVVAVFGDPWLRCQHPDYDRLGIAPGPICYGSGMRQPSDLGFDGSREPYAKIYCGGDRTLDFCARLEGMVLRGIPTIPVERAGLMLGAIADSDCSR
jgi:hypothetical protein